MEALARSVLNKLARVEFSWSDGCVATKHPAIPVARIRCMSMSEGQRQLNVDHVDEIFDKICKNPMVTVQSLQLVVLDFAITPKEVVDRGVDKFDFGTTGGNHYMSALHRVKKLKEEFFNANASLHYKDGEIYAFGNLRKLLAGTVFLTHYPSP